MIVFGELQTRVNYVCLKGKNRSLGKTLSLEGTSMQSLFGSLSLLAIFRFACTQTPQNLEAELRLIYVQKPTQSLEKSKEHAALTLIFAEHGFGIPFQAELG